MLLTDAPTSATKRPLTTSKAKGSPMKDGFITVAAVTPHLRVADVGYNTEQTLASIREA